jgi:hypothetical protein
MDVYHVELDRGKLAAMPEAERVLLLLLAHASNEINVLTKLILIMSALVFGELSIVLPQRH